VSVGGARDGDVGAEDPERSVWWSDDATTWHRASGKPFAGALVEGIVGGAAGFIAWGGLEAGASVFHSSDGVSWDRVETGDLFAGTVIHAAVAYRGGYVAIGAHVPRGPLPVGGPDGSIAAAWWSPDGRTWQAAATDAGPRITQVFAGASGLLAIGASECGSCIAPALVWRSDDGRSWHRLPADPRDTTVFPMYASDGARIVRFDWQGSGEVATSADGRAWRSLGFPGKGDLYDLVVGKDGLLILQSIPKSAADDEVDGVVWYVSAT
jgi:hypothetical protein